MREEERMEKRGKVRRRRAERQQRGKLANS